MKERAARDLPQQRLVHAHRFCNRDRERGHALAVSFGLRILRVQRPAQRFQRVVVRLLQVLQRDGKLLGAFGDQMFEVALVSPVFEHQLPVFQRPAHAQVKLILLEWLENVVVSPGADCFERDRDVVHRCDHDHRDVGIVHAQLRQQLQPVHFRHDDVAQHQIERILAKGFECQAPVCAGCAADSPAPPEEWK